MEKAVKQLTTLVPTGADWPYTLVWLNGDTCHAPLPREGHLSTLVEGTNSATSRRVSQLEVCQLLSSSSQVFYPARLNGCVVPIIVSLPKLLAKGTNLLGGKPIYLKVNIPQPVTEKPELKVPPLGSHSSSILMPSPVRAPPPRAEGDHGSEGAPILGDVRHFQTCVKDLHPKETKSHGHTHTSSPQTGRFPQTSGHIIPGECPG